MKGKSNLVTPLRRPASGFLSRTEEGWTLHSTLHSPMWCRPSSPWDPVLCHFSPLRALCSCADLPGRPLPGRPFPYLERSLPRYHSLHFIQIFNLPSYLQYYFLTVTFPGALFKLELLFNHFLFLSWLNFSVQCLLQIYITCTYLSCLSSPITS